MDKVYYRLLTGDIVTSDFDIDYSNISTKLLKKLLNDYARLFSQYNMYQKGVINQFVFDIYNILNKADITEVQWGRLFMWFQGYGENDIAIIENVSRSVIHKSIHAACEKILRELIKLKGVD